MASHARLRSLMTSVDAHERTRYVHPSPLGSGLSATPRTDRNPAESLGKALQTPEGDLRWQCTPASANG